MSIFGQKIGGDRYCRKCGGYHSAVPSHHCTQGKVSPLQDAQMAIENLEEFLEKASIRISAREEVEKLTSILREKLKIPKEKIYCEQFYFPEEIKAIKEFGRRLSKEFPNSLNKARGKKTEISPKSLPKIDYDYNPPIKILEKSAEVFWSLERILNGNLFTTELSKKEYDSIIKLVKEKVLKL